MIKKNLRLLMLGKNKIKDLGPLLEAIRRDAEGEKRMAPFLRLYLAGNPVPGGQIAKLKGYGVRVNPKND